MLLMLNEQGDDSEIISHGATTEQLLQQFSNSDLEDKDPLNWG